MKYKTFLEVMAGPNIMRMTQSEKRVLRKTIDANDPQLAADEISRAKDSRNLIAASKTLSKYGYIITNPIILGFDDEPNAIELTDKGQEAIDKYDIQNDDTLITKDEQENSSPETPPPAINPNTGAEVEPTPAAGQNNPNLKGNGVGLELSSFFRSINDLVTIFT
jgi:hypothetical protein